MMRSNLNLNGIVKVSVVFLLTVFALVSCDRAPGFDLETEEMLWESLDNCRQVLIEQSGQALASTQAGFNVSLSTLRE
jgi:hypothetical protein